MLKVNFIMDKLQGALVSKSKLKKIYTVCVCIHNQKYKRFHTMARVLDTNTCRAISILNSYVCILNINATNVFTLYRKYIIIAQL